MKKTFMAPSVSTIDIQAERLLGGASTIQESNATHTDGGVKGGNGGDGLAKVGSGMGTMSRITTWSMGKMDF